MLAVSEWWTVGSDLAVAAGTIGLAWFTWRLARQTRTLAVETGEDVRAGARPVLLDAAQGRPPHIVLQEGSNFGEVFLDIVNAGHGPALNAFTYVQTATANETRATDLTIIGNLPPGETLAVRIGGVLGTDVSGSDAPYLSLRMIFGYSNLANRTHYSVVLLSDPGHGLPRTFDTNGQADIRLDRDATEVGEGPAPQQQWRVTFRGAALTHNQLVKLRADAIEYVSGHEVAGTHSSSVFLSAHSAKDAIARVQAVLGPRAPFAGYDARPFQSPPLLFEKPSRSDKAATVVRRWRARVSGVFKRRKAG